MIIRSEDVQEFIEAYSDFQTGYAYIGTQKRRFGDSLSEFLNWLNEHPQCLIASGFREYVAGGNLQFDIHPKVVDPTPHPFFRTPEGVWFMPGHIDCAQEVPWRAWTYSQILEMGRLAETRSELIDEIVDNPSVVLPSAQDIIQNLEKQVSCPRIGPATLISPQLWTPRMQREQSEQLKSCALPILIALQHQKRELKDLTWRQFEDIVAEVLRASGMEIHAIRNSPQGGRDIVARGALIPGTELVYIAIEVKHRQYVDRPELDKALYQNRQFPALMFVTSGRFSAGVIRESQLPENRLRLFLKDGVAIRDLIRAYGL
ncbi:MAG: restriction endonuclease [Candidatus Eisenbacteria bacterium]|nr:restriction endonuclease [Candidatus Eisenbacteria bacterium]